MDRGIGGLQKHAGENMKEKGFTLIELLITLAVLIIVITIAVPGFQRMIATNRVAADYNSVLSGLNLARSEAIKRRTPVTFSVTQSSPWAYEVFSDADVFRQRTGQNDRTSLTEFSITFDALGKPQEDINCPAGCRITLSNTFDGIESRELEISAQGRVARRYGDDNNEE